MRFKLVAVGLTSCCVASYVLSCLMELRVAREVSSAVAFSPFYLLGNIDPTFFLLFFMGALFLVFDVDHTSARDRITDALHSRPVRNVEFLFGRVFGTASLIWLIAASNLLAMQGFGLLAQVSDLGIGSVFQLHSLFNLVIVDIPAALLLWCSLVVLLSIVLRFRVLVVSISLVLLLAWHHAVAGAPYSLLELVSASSNDTLLISDIVPELPSFASLAMRIGAVALAAAIVGIAAWLYQRRDNFSVWHSSVVVGSCLIGSLAIVTATTHVVLRNSQVETWKQAHANYVWKDNVDILEMAGTLLIDPRDRLHFDLEIDFSLNNEDPTSTFALVFNPAMEISILELDGTPSEFEFRNGILEVQSASPLDTSGVQTMRIVAEGIPSPRFAYLDAPFDYLADPSLPIQVTHAFGRDGSIYDTNYVALMPGVHWYPSTRRYASEFGERPDPDFFGVNMEVELSNTNWQLVGPGISRIGDEEVNKYLVRVERPIPQLGLFASEFETVSATLAGVSLAAHIHIRHAENLNVSPEVMKELENSVENSFNQAFKLGLELAQPSLSFVEVPNRLRTVGGGWRMDALNALPGVVLVKERTFPVANIALEPLEHEQPNDRFEELQAFFGLGLGTDNSLRNLPAHYWTHFTAAHGEYAEVLDLIVLNLLWNTPPHGWSFSFSPYSTIRLVPLMMLSASVTSDLGEERGPTWFGRQVVLAMEHRFAARSVVWEQLAETPLDTIPSGFGHQTDLEVALLKSRKIAEALMEYHGRDYEKILAWLMAVRKRFAGRTYSYEDLIATAEEHGIETHPFLTDWLTMSSPPGFVMSPAKVSRISDDDGYPRLQITMDIRNTESVSGIVIPWHRTTGLDQPITIGPDNARRINILLTNPPLDQFEYSFRLFSGLSLNRDSVEVRVDLSTIGEQSTQSPSMYIEDSSWEPESRGIVIDDLDPGFTIEQPKIEATRKLTSGPMGWFRSLNPEIEHFVGYQDMDSLYQPKLGWWIRLAEENAYGVHRRTTAVATVRNRTKLHGARFSANIPESDNWKLDYHIPNCHLGWVFNIELRISNGTESWDVLFDPSYNSFGWLPVGEFQLNEGNATVEIMGSTFRSTLYADAIRWTRVTESQ